MPERGRTFRSLPVTLSEAQTLISEMQMIISAAITGELDQPEWAEWAAKAIYEDEK